MAQLATMKELQMKDGTARAGANEVGVSGTVLGNHSSAPEWIELLPAGDFAGRDGRGPFRLSNPGRVIAATDGLRMEAGLPIDYDHATDFAAPAGRPAPAAGWIRAMEVRDGALWGQVEWTLHGAAAVVTHEYRYISPVFEYSQDGEVQRLLRAALTNNPNLYLTAISARAIRNDAEGSEQFTRARNGAEADRLHEGSGGMDNLEMQLRELFGLGEEARPEAIVAAARSLLHEGRGYPNGGSVAHEVAHTTTVVAGADPARYVPVAQFESALTELNRLRAASARERAELRVDAAMRGSKIVPAQREWAITYCQANPRGFEEFIARQPAVLSGIEGRFEGEPSTGRISVNERDGMSLGRSRVNVALTRTELAVCAQLGLRPQEFLKRRGMRVDFPTMIQE